jgi:hypothetical protein
MECASVSSVLRPCPVANTLARADSFGGMLRTCSQQMAQKMGPTGGAPGRTRTDTVRILSPLPLPLGYGGAADSLPTQRRPMVRQPTADALAALPARPQSPLPEHVCSQPTDLSDDEVRSRLVPVAVSHSLCGVCS